LSRVVVGGGSSSSPLVQIKELDGAAKLSKPAVLVGVPEMGLVGTIASSYIMEHLGLPEIASVYSEIVPPVIVVQDAEPKQPIRIFGKGVIAVVISEVPLTSRFSYELMSEVVNWSQAKQCKMIIGATGLPSEDRVESAGESTPVVFAVTNDKELRKTINSIGARPFERGVITSTYATLMRRCIDAGVTDMTLLAESYGEFPDPGAAAAAIQVLNKFLPISVDVKPLLEGAEEIRLRMRGLMSQTQEAIQQGNQATASAYR
jgi:uncharacterized protein